MQRKAMFLLTIGLGLAAAGLLAGMAVARTGLQAPVAIETVPGVVSYQGEVRVDGQPYSGTGYFKFAVVNAGGTYTFWTNDGTHLGSGVAEPDGGVQVGVQAGLFAVLLGNSADQVPLTPNVFADAGRRLNVWFSQAGSPGSFTDLGRTVVAAVPYALNAETLDGLDSSYYDPHYQHVVVVAQGGGDYTSVQTAIDDIGDASADNPYLIWVAPGTYSETVTMKPYVHLQGAGQEVTFLTSNVSNDDYIPAAATVMLAQQVSLRDLTVVNGGTGTSNAALLATEDTTGTLVSDVTARAEGAGDSSMAIVVADNGSVTLLDVTALARNGSVDNTALQNYEEATVQGGVYTAYGQGATGLGNVNGTLRAENVTALGEGSAACSGLSNNSGGTVILHGGSFTGRGGDNAYGLWNDYAASLEAQGVTALGEGATITYGLYNHYDSSTVTVSQSTLEGATSPAVRGGGSGPVSLYHCRLISDNPVSGTVTCVAVSRGTNFGSTSCP